MDGLDYLRSMEQLREEVFDSVINNSLLARLGEHDRAALFAVHHLRSYTANEEIFRSQTDGKSFYIVAEGSFRLVLGNGVSKTLNRGELIGEIAALADLERLGTLVCQSREGALLVFSRRALENAGVIPPAEQPNLLTLLFANSVNYLHELLDNSTESLLQRGEGERTEFKEGSYNPNLLKPIAGFLNTTGGTVLIGVNDEGEVIGVDEYSNATADKFDQDFRNLLRDKLGSDALAFIRFSHGRFGEHGIYRIDCEPADQPVFMRTGKGVSGETFYIRSGSTNQQLGFRAALHYIARRFPNELFIADEPR